MIENQLNGSKGLNPRNQKGSNASLSPEMLRHGDSESKNIIWESVSSLRESQVRLI